MMDALNKNIAETAVQLATIKQAVRIDTAKQLVAMETERPSLQAMQQKVWVNSRWPIAWPDWPKGIVAKGTAVWQKLLRQLLQWYIDPIVHQQNEFNKATLQAIQLLSQDVAELSHNTAVDSQQVELISQHLHTLSNQVGNQDSIL
ncbi:MAG: hypothetical protein GY943_18595 [Chloroflexi bacterium]|nr:hypothetical protein [Chloroflexota bacterium]